MNNPMDSQTVTTITLACQQVEAITHSKQMRDFPEIKWILRTKDIPATLTIAIEGFNVSGGTDEQNKVFEKAKVLMEKRLKAGDTGQYFYEWNGSNGVATLRD